MLNSSNNRYLFFQKSNLGYRPGTRNIFSFNRIVLSLHQVVVAFSHKIVVLAVKCSIMRITYHGASSAALHLRAYPLSSSACTSITTFWHARSRLEQFAPQFTWTFLWHDASTLMLQSAYRTETTFFAFRTFASRLKIRKTRCFHLRPA